VVSRLLLEGVTYHYPATPSPALDGVSLAVGAGEVVAVIGSVGAGASTLLLVAAGLAPRVLGGTLSGQVRREGQSALLLPTPWTQVSGMAFTVWDEVAFAPANLGWPRERIATAVERAMARVGVGALRDRDPATLSGGELQRVILAGILAVDPQLLLLDEPTAELDPAATRAAWQLWRDLAGEGAAVVVATSDLDALPDAVDRVIWIAGGRLRADGPARAVLEDPALDTPDGPGSTSIATVWRGAGLASPVSLTVQDALRRLT
jgi:energy-coupling factor transporter ATP-binding protein EcfA2